MAASLKRALADALRELGVLTPSELVAQRYELDELRALQGKSGLTRTASRRGPVRLLGAGRCHSGATLLLL